MSEKINAGDAALKVIEDWGVKRIYGLPGGSFDSMMNALYNERGNVQFVQVRHEEAGALAASAEAKLTGRIGVCFGSAGPGAVHLLNGLYDAREDHAPVLALVGQVPQAFMNIDFFQAMDEEPIFADVAVFNRTATNAEGLPALIDESIREAYAHHGVAVVTIPKDLAWAPIEPKAVASAKNFRPAPPIAPPEDLISEAAELVKNAHAPLLYFGMGAKHAHDELVEISQKFKLPIVSTHPAKGVIDDEFPAYLGSAGRVATKSANEAVENSDVILWVGNDCPFATKIVKPGPKIIQIDNDPAKLGKRLQPQMGLAMLADAKSALRALIDRGEPLAETNFYRACLANKRNWEDWIASFREDDRAPLRPEPIFDILNRALEPQDLLAIDVGNVNINFARLTHLKPTNRWSTSGKHGTMGYAVPASLAMKLARPDATVYSLSGDGGFAMLSEEILAQLKYHAPVVNVVFSNQTLGFIEAEQRDDSHQPLSGVDLPDTDWAKVAEGYGARGFTVRTLDDARKAFAEAKTLDRSSVIDVKLTGAMPLTTLYMHLSEGDDPAKVREYADKYEAHALKAFDFWLRQEETR